MNLIAVTDIFGKTEAFEKLIDEISGNFDAVDIVAPYEKENINFTDEFEAYAYFQKYIGLDKYIDLLSSKIENIENTRYLLLGFSVGASAIWVVAKKLKTSHDVKAICFYPSQIRNYLRINPRVEIEIYFAKHEPTYDVSDIYNEISEKPNVQFYKTKYLHGFMNEISKNYNPDGYNKYIKILKSVTNGCTRSTTERDR